jgi:hypothetical protein
MITLTERSSEPVTLRAPVAGVVRFHAPRALCGELEVFDGGETIADVGTTEIVAPSRGYIVRRLVPEGIRVDDALPLIVFGAA